MLGRSAGWKMKYRHFERGCGNGLEYATLKSGLTESLASTSSLISAVIVMRVAILKPRFPLSPRGRPAAILRVRLSEC